MPNAAGDQATSCIQMCVGMCIDMCIDMCVDMCVDMPIGHRLEGLGRRGSDRVLAQVYVVRALIEASISFGRPGQSVPTLTRGVWRRHPLQRL